MKSTFIRAATALVIVSVLFLVIEVMPLHFGTRNIPWNAIPEHIKEKLPRFILIATMVTTLIAIKGNKHSSPPRAK